MKKRDGHTLDMFAEFAPQPVVERFAPEDVRSPSLSARISLAVSRTLKDHGADRAAVAKEMSAYLDEPVTKAMLDAYASQGRESHNIPAHRLIALVLVTGDPRPLNALLVDAELIVVEAKYEALLRREMLRDAKHKLEREEAAADTAWKAQR
jgi:hypothetical protein